MDRQWIRNTNRVSDEYLYGIESFIQVAQEHVNAQNNIRCPCRNCNNSLWKTVREVRIHLVKYGMSHNYTTWYYHGEPRVYASTSSETRTILQPTESVADDNDQVMGIINDAYPYASLDHEVSQDDTESDNMDQDDGLPEVQREEFDKYERLLKQAQRELYSGCEEFSVLTAVVELMHWKVLNQHSNRSYDQLMGILKRMLPKNNHIPETHYLANKVLKDLGLGYEKIHACKNDCVLFYKEHQGKDKCPVCNEPRYKNKSVERKKQIPQKVLRYFPLKPRLQRLYMSTHTASDMRWHKDKRVEDDVMRHPADGSAWKEFDKIYPDFAADARNVRLGLATDGFNPFGNMSTSHSTWPVVVVPYNLPPWKCMKKEFTIMTLLIPGPQSPGKEIDVYLRPLIDELKELWQNGVPTYDKSTETMFSLRAAVMWTINDFPAYGNLSGWSTKGYMACPTCNKDITSAWHSGKVCYMGHRRWLPGDHKWRHSKEAFDGKKEMGVKPKELSGDDILRQLNNLEFGRIGKHPSNKERNMPRSPAHLNWTNKSIFFELEYWSKLKIRHNLDVMHIEKNVCESLVGTILGIEGKSKDTIKARQDLQEMGIRKHLWLTKKGDKMIKKHPFYTMKPVDKKEFLKFLASVKFPDGYAANISRNVKIDSGKILGLKSHDCHVLLQRLLPVGIRKFLPEDVVEPIVGLSRFFQHICAKTLRVSDMAKLKDEIVYILCKFEQIFPPAFFDIMIHLMIHLPQEAILAGPVSYRWMYPIER